MVHKVVPVIICKRVPYIIIRFKILGNYIILYICLVYTRFFFFVCTVYI